MKKHNKKLITLMLAGLCAVSLSAAVVGTAVQADETPAGKKAISYEISEIFSTTGSVDGTSGTVAFTLGNDEYARIKRDLAFKWYEGKNDARYLTIKFAFKELNFTSMLFEIESASSIATEEGKAVNAVKFTVEEGKVYAAVVNGKTEGAKFETSIKANETVTLQLKAGSSLDAFGVTVNSAEIGEFTTIGANYADYDSAKTYPLEINAKTESDKEAVVLLQEINGQSFTNVVDGKIADTAAPVLVVNEEIYGFEYGTLFSLAYEKIDVLQASSLSDAKTYYQYNPADSAIDHSAKLTTSTRFMDTVYYTNGTKVAKTRPEGDEGKAYKATSVIAEDGREYVSIKVTLGDGTFDDTKNSDGTIPFAKKTYDLSWYASESALAPKTVGETTAEFIVIDENDEGAKYTHLKTNDETKENEYVDKAEFEKQVAAYQKQIDDKVAEDKPLAGSNVEFKLPGALDWLIKDNRGYRALKFTICYRTPSSSTGKTASNLNFDDLTIPTAEEGLYEFKVFANDAANNTMQYYHEGKLVSVSSSNIWDIDEIPSFTFEIANKGIEVEEKGNISSKKKTEKKVNETFTLSGLTILGATNQQSAYTLYRFDETKGGITVEDEKLEKALVSVTYKTIRTEALKLLDKVGKGKTYETYFDLYLDIYVDALAKELKQDKAKVAKCFVEISEYNDKITENDPEWDAYNKYEWKANSKSFKAVEEGTYLIFGDFWEKELPVQRAAAYHVVFVDTKADTIKGESKVLEWIKNNVVSVVLFGVAAVMLILIIILLLVKPSDETLEDVDKEVAKKKDKKKEDQKEDE